MDILLFAQLPACRRPPLRGPGAEEAYWRTQAGLPLPGFRLLVSLASIAGVILLLVGVGQV